MLNVTQIVEDYKIELMQKWIGRQIASIVLPPSTSIILGNLLIWSKQITLGIHDCFESGYADLLNVGLQGNGTRKVDYEMHQALGINIEKSNNPSDAAHFFSESFYAPPPTYGTYIGFDEGRFKIKKIEIYNENFVLDENGKNMGAFNIKTKYSKSSVHVNNDCVFILYDEKDRILVFEAERGGFNIYSDANSLNKVINRFVNGYTTYETPVALNKRIEIK